MQGRSNILTQAHALAASGHIAMRGNETFKKAVRRLAEVSEEALAQCNMEPADVDFSFSNVVARVHEDPRVTLPYTDEAWARVDALGEEVDARLVADDVRLTLAAMLRARGEASAFPSAAIALDGWLENARLDEPATAVEDRYREILDLTRETDAVHSWVADRPLKAIDATDDWSLDVPAGQVAARLAGLPPDVLQAARESEDAMAGYVGARQQADILAEAVESAKRSNQLATLRYREGFSDYQRVLDSQQALFSQQQRYIAARGEAVLNLIGLFQALGGGWEADSVPRVRQETLEAMQQRTDWGQLIDVIEPVDSDRTYPRPDW